MATMAGKPPDPGENKITPQGAERQVKNQGGTYANTAKNTPKKTKRNILEISVEKSTTATKPFDKEAAVRMCQKLGPNVRI